MKMSDIQTDIFNQFSATFTTDTITRWEELVIAWDTNPENVPNPYREPTSGELLFPDFYFLS